LLRFRRLLFAQVGLELTGRLFYIATGDDVVPLEHGLSLVAADRHRHTLRHARADKVSDSRSPKVVKQQARQLRSIACRFPSLVEAANSSAAANKNKLGIGVFLLLNFQHVAQLAEERDRAWLLVFRFVCVEPNLSASEVNTVPTNF